MIPFSAIAWSLNALASKVKCVPDSLMADSLGRHPTWEGEGDGKACERLLTATVVTARNMHCVIVCHTCDRTFASSVALAIGVSGWLPGQSTTSMRRSREGH